MRTVTWGGVLLTLISVTPVVAPRGGLVSAGSAQDITYQKVIDAPQLATPTTSRTTEVLSFRHMLSKVFPFISPSVAPAVTAAMPSSKTKQTNPLQPMLPTTKLPAATPGTPYAPLLPRTSLPPIPDSSKLKQAPPIK